MAATYWPDAEIPGLLDTFKHSEDKILLPLLAAAAQSHRGVVPVDLYERLVQSPDSQHRTIAIISMESLTAEDVLPNTTPLGAAR